MLQPVLQSLPSVTSTPAPTPPHPAVGWGGVGERVYEVSPALPPKVIAQTEKLLFLPRLWRREKSWTYPSINFGVPLSALPSPSLPLKPLLEIFRGEAFAVAFHVAPSGFGAREEVRIAVTDKASADDLLRAAIAAYLLAEHWHQGLADGKEEAAIVAHSIALLPTVFPLVKRALREAGWQIDAVSLGQPSWIASWN